MYLAEYQNKKRVYLWATHEELERLPEPVHTTCMGGEALVEYHYPIDDVTRVALRIAGFVLDKDDFRSRIRDWS